MNFCLSVFAETWNLLLDSSPYILFGIFIAGLIRVFLKPESVSRHLGQGKVKSVLKASLLGIPLPLCSCGVLPAAAGLKRQGATNGATTAFLISTPESGVDSIALTYALLDPIMTVIRPVAAFITASVAGILENFSFAAQRQENTEDSDKSCTVDGCCDGKECPPDVHNRHHTFTEKAIAGLRFAFKDLWGDLAAWFFLGLFFAGIITATVPPEFASDYLGGGIESMLLILLVAVPLYICATASTPIAAALILKGVSPGAALVFLLVGPATNVASLTVLLKLLGKRATAIYLFSIILCAVLFGLGVDQIYSFFGISAQATIGVASEMLPDWIKLGAAIFLLVMSVKPVYRSVMTLLDRFKSKPSCATDCGCQKQTN